MALNRLVTAKSNADAGDRCTGKLLMAQNTSHHAGCANGSRTFRDRKSVLGRLRDHEHVVGIAERSPDKLTATGDQYELVFTSGVIDFFW